MITIQQAKSLIEQYSPQPASTDMPLMQAFGRTLAHDVRAPQPSPACDNSAMDGFAIRYEDVAHAGQDPVTLKIIGESRAGVPFDGAVSPMTAVRINTGAKMPSGADTVVPIEDCRVNDDAVTLIKPVKPNQHVRHKGEEFNSDDILLRAGTTVHPPQIAMLAYIGMSSVPVFQPPGVSIIVTGSELRRVDETIQDYQVRDSNSPMLAAAVRAAGGDIRSIQQVGDDLLETVEALKRAEAESDIILFTGGVSVGPYDHVKEAARQSGFEQKFWKVRQKPGKPFFFAVKGNTLLFGLPGNPVSAFMNYVVYIDPMIRRLTKPDYTPEMLAARSMHPIQNRGGRTQLYRVALDQSTSPPTCTLLQRQGSHMITSIAAADGYIIAEPNREIDRDEIVNVYLFPWRS